MLKKARFKLKKNSYILDGFAYALQIWLMEAIPDIGTLLGQKYKEGITSVRKKEDHLFKQVDETMFDELRRIDAQQALIEEEIDDLKNCLKKAE